MIPRWSLALIVTGLLFAGCGKSSEEKAMEADLNQQILDSHHQQMAKLANADEMADKVDFALARIDSLTNAHKPVTGSASKSDLLAARDKLNSSRDAMESWMASHQVYNVGIKHDLAMQEMKMELDALHQVAAQMDSAIAFATRTVSAYETSLAPGSSTRH